MSLNRKKNDSTLIKAIYNAKKELLNQQEETYYQQLKELKTDPELNGKGREKPLFRIANSSLGKTEITGSDLSKFNFEYHFYRFNSFLCYLLYLFVS